MNDLMPHDLRAEKDLLSLLLADPKAFKDCQGSLSPDVFYHAYHAEIYKAMHQSSVAGKNVNAYTTSEMLAENGKLKTIGGDDFLLELQNNALFALSAKELSLILFQKYIRRKIIEGCLNSVKKAFDETVDGFDVLDDVRNNILAIHTNLNKTSRRNLSDIVDSYYQSVLNAINSGGQVQGIRTYIPSLDNRLNGLGKGNMITIAGRPGTGKTALLIQIIVNTCLNNNKKRFLVYSIEMTGEQLINRIVSCLMKFPYSRIAKGDIPVERHNEFLDWVKFVKRCKSLEIIDNISDIDEITLDAKSRHDTEPVDGVIIDYLQLCKAKHIKGGNREQQVSHISSSIKNSIAKGLMVPVIALAQLNRDTEKQDNKKPQLQNLRESGSLEQDSDSVTFLYRPLYSGFKEDEDGQQISDKECWLLTRKNRHGPVGEDEVWCDITCNIFRDKGYYEEPPSKPGNSFKLIDYSATRETDETPF